jgi:hypothetical protein
MTEKSILEQALLQVNTLEEAVKQNAKGILSSVMKKELNELLKESEEVEEEDNDVAPKEEESKDMSEQPADDEADDDNEEMPSINDEPSKDIDGDDMDSEMGDDEPGMDDEMEPEMDDMPDFGDSGSDEDMLDMTGASDEEVLKVFKAMSDEDGIIVKKDGENIELQDGDDEYIIKLDESEEDEAHEEFSEEWNEDEMAEEDETVYEIEIDEEEEVDLEASEEESMEIEATEASRSMAFGQKGLTSKKIFKVGRKEEINEELQTLKKQNDEYKKALVLFKDKLNEVAVFNANLAHATRLFTEHTTTKQEKMDILKRFDTVSTINESKNLFNSIRTELTSKKPVTESVAAKIASAPSTSSSQEMLSESKAYEAPQFRRMRDLMSKLK